MTSAAVEIQGLTKTYRGRRVLDGVHLSVERGQVCCVIGPNGAGKTTLLETIAGLRKVESGEVEVLGLCPDRDKAKLQARIAVQAQGGVLPKTETVQDILGLWSSVRPGGESVESMLSIFGLRQVASSRLSKLSGGEVQRLRLALALIPDPDLILLDEPTTGLDPISTDQMWNIIRGRSDGLTVFMNTQSMDEAQKLADIVFFLSRGKILAGGCPSELVQKYAYGGRLIIRSQKADTSRVVDFCKNAPGVSRMKISRSIDGANITLLSEDPESLQKEAERFGYAVIRHQASLEDVFFYLDEGDEDSLTLTTECR